ncbi:hypothetical protein ACFL1U_03035 [Patescibacteria group bacterium]
MSQSKNRAERRRIKKEAPVIINWWPPIFLIIVMITAVWFFSQLYSKDTVRTHVDTRSQVGAPAYERLYLEADGEVRFIDEYAPRLLINNATPFHFGWQFFNHDQRIREAEFKINRSHLNSENIMLALESDWIKCRAILGSVIDFLINTHPKREIREELPRLHNEDILLLEFHSAVDMRHEAPVAFFGVHINDEGHPQPSLCVYVEMLLDPLLSDKVLQLYIWHEFQHAKDYLNGNVNCITIMKDGIPSAEDIANWNQESARLLLLSECRAWLETCKLTDAMEVDEKEISPFRSIYRAYKTGGPKEMTSVMISSHYGNIELLKPYSNDLEAWASEWCQSIQEQ